MKKAAKGVATVDEYLAEVSEPARSTLSKMRAMIRSIAPEATEAISYGMPAFKYKGRGLVAYAAFKNHCSFFPMSGAVVESFAAELKGYATSKGTIQFPSDKGLPAGLVKKIVKAKMAAVEEKAGGK